MNCIEVLYMYEEEFSLEEVVKTFEESWRELTQEYPNARLFSTFCSEADVELHLAHKLINKLHPRLVHIEFPLPLEIERLYSELMSWGRVSMKECIKSDITVIDAGIPRVYLISEIKFYPIYWNLIPPILAIKGHPLLDEKVVNAIKEDLKTIIEFLEKTRSQELSQEDIKIKYFGVDNSGRTKVEKLIKILIDLKEKLDQEAYGYLCVIDEFHPDVKEMLERAVQRFNPPSQFKILAYHPDLLPHFKKVLEELEKL